MSNSYVYNIKDADNSVNYYLAHTFYGTCSTAASTAAKTVTLANSIATSSSDTIPTGFTVTVKFTYSNTASLPTLTVGNWSAKNIYKYGTTAPETTVSTSWYAGAMITFTYDGSAWIMNDHMDDTTGETGTDTKVTQTASTTSAWRKVMGSYNTASSATGSITSDTTNILYFDQDGPAYNNSTSDFYIGGTYYMALGTSDSLYAAINSAGWVSDVIE